MGTLLWPLFRYGVFSVRKEARLEKYLIIERNTIGAPILQYSSNEIKAWFTVRVKKLLIQEAVE